MVKDKQSKSDFFSKILEAEQTSGIILIICAVFALVISNSQFQHEWFSIWEYKVGIEAGGLKKTLSHWINDGLMAIFFLLVGLEIKREITEGELSSLKNAVLPVAAAIGGMLIPALIYILLNVNKPGASGWGIPMATDIAFALGVLALLGPKVPFSLKIMLTALAIVDDLGAIIVIAVFYTDNLAPNYLLYASLILALLIFLNVLGVKYLSIYLLIGLFLWYFTLKSQIHATVAGVLLALTIPLGKNEKKGPAEILEHAIHKPVTFLIMPLFALANTGFEIEGDIYAFLNSSISLGIFFGLFLGKAIGIFGFSYLAIKLGLTSMPQKAGFGQILGVGFLGGIGFTMSIFIALLAFAEPGYQSFAKLSILGASLVSGIVGYFTIKYSS